MRTNWAALSPNGKYLAYSLREQNDLAILVVPIDQPERATAKVIVATDKSSTPNRLVQRYVAAEENTPASIQWIGWATNSRLVVATNRQMSVGLQTNPPPGTDPEVVWTNFEGAVYAFDADGGNAKLLISPRKLFSSFQLLGLHPSKPGTLLIGGNFEYELDAGTGKTHRLSSGKFKKLDREMRDQSAAPTPLDRSGVGKLHTLFPNKRVDIIGSTTTENRLLALVQNPVDAGAFYVLEPTAGKCLEFARRSISDKHDGEHQFHTFTVRLDTQDELTGWIVLPHTSRTKKAPIVVLDFDIPRPLNDGDREAAKPDAFRPEVSALAEMGFAVVQLTKATKYETLTRVCAALGQLSQTYAINPKYVALFCSKSGAQSALPNFYNPPASLRCAVFLRPRLAIRKTSSKSQTENAFAITKDEASDGSRLPLLLACEYRARADCLLALAPFSTSAAGRVTVSHLDLSDDFLAGRPRALAAAFGEIETFLNLHLYAYKSEAGVLKIVDE
ncbi:MAG: hypothetical protein QM790_01055 [Nibricoccus sp.]